MDENFGRLIKIVDTETLRPDPRAISTCEVVGIDREILQKKRSIRHGELKRMCSLALSEYNSGYIDRLAIRARLTGLRNAPFQADVADYFLNGPGRISEPFKSLLEAAGETLP